MTRTIRARHALVGPDYETRQDVSLTLADGRIESVSRAEGATDPLFALPVLVNAHDHARPVRSSSYGAAGKPLELWLNWLSLVPAVDPYLATAVSLGRAALGGAGAVMVHYTRVQGLSPLPEEAADVARAARDVGVRIGFAVALRDRNPLVYGPSDPILAALPPAARAEVEKRFLKKPLPVRDLLAMVDAVAEAAEGPLVDVQYGPAAVQWCSDDLLRAIAEASERTGRRVHMHLLETRPQREWADKAYPGGIVRHLRDIGLLSPRITLAHCAWAREDELEIIAESGATISVNTSSNLGIRSGLAPVAVMLKAGCKVAIGLDGLAFNEDDDSLAEMRLTNALHRGWGFDRVIAENDMLRIALRAGRANVTGSAEGGVISAGAPADLLLLDWAALDSDRLLPDVPPTDLLFARARAKHITEVIVAGRSIVRDGVVAGVDHPGLEADLLDRLRTGFGGNVTFREALRSLDGVVTQHYCPGCC
jgi:cytosine/adenosine deaminase-related metal-dependent hydrolase